MNKRRNRRKGGRINIEKNTLILILLVVGIVVVVFSDFSPWATYAVGEDASVDIDYQNVIVNTEMIWDRELDLSDVYLSVVTLDTLNFDADDISGIPVIPSSVHSGITFNPQVGSDFGTPRGLVSFGDSFVEQERGDLIISYGEELLSGYKHLYYKMRFTMCVSAFGDTYSADSSVIYTTQNGKPVNGTELPTTKMQKMIFTMSISTALTKDYPEDTRFVVSTIELGPKPDDLTHTISEVDTGQTRFYDTFADDNTKPVDEPYITDYYDILIDYGGFGPNDKTTDSTFTVALDLAPGAVFDAEAGEWYMRDAIVYFDVDVEFKFVVNEYSDARWAGTWVDAIIAKIPAKIDLELIRTDPFGAALPFLAIGSLLIAAIVAVYITLGRKVREGGLNVKEMVGIT